MTDDVAQNDKDGVNASPLKDLQIYNQYRVLSTWCGGDIFRVSTENGAWFDRLTRGDIARITKLPAHDIDRALDSLQQGKLVEYEGRDIFALQELGKRFVINTALKKAMSDRESAMQDWRHAVQNRKTIESRCKLAKKENRMQEWQRGRDDLNAALEYSQKCRKLLDEKKLQLWHIEHLIREAE